MQQTNQKISNSEYEALISKTLNTNFIKEKTIVYGKVVSIENDIVIIDVGLKSEGRIPVSEFSRPGQTAEIEVGDKTSLKEYSQDLWINTQVRGVAAKTLGLRALSFNFETIKGKVFIAGITSREKQLEQLIESIKNIKGVKEIVNYVILKEK